MAPASAPTGAAVEPDRNEAAALLARGRATLSNGDVAGARVFLRRAAEHNDPQAALALGETYDPVVLKHLGVIKFNGDVALAQEWYRRAADLGLSAPDTAGSSAPSIDPAGPKVAAGDPGGDHGAEPHEQPQAAEQKTAAMSQDEVCTREAAQLANLRISQSRDEVTRFERELACEKLRPQVIRLRESVNPQ
jgi:TPR repeat protein